MRREEDRRLLVHIEHTKRRLDNQKKIIIQSIEPPEDVLNQAKMTEALYSFLIREARIRNLRANKL